MKPDPPAGAAAFQQALALYRAGNPAAAIPILRALAERQPPDAQVLFYLGTAQLQAGNAGEAVRALEGSLRLLPNPNACNNLGLALQRLDQPARALASFEQAVQLNPGFADAHYNRAAALQALGRFDEALAGYDRAIQLRPANANAFNNRGVVLRRLGREQEALACVERAIQLAPEQAQGHCNRGNALADLKQLERALQSYQRALQLQPDYPEALNNIGGVLSDLGRPDEALASYDRALQLNPGYAEAHYNRAKVLRDLGRLDEALLAYGRALELKPANDYWAGEWLYTKITLGDWSDLDGAVARLSREIDAGGRAASPFVTLLVCDSPQLQKRAAELWAIDKFRLPVVPLSAAARPAGSRLRLAYLSADFHSHATMHLIGELLEKHDRSRFELIAFSFGPETNDPSRQRARRAFDRFFDVRDRLDREVAELARQLGIDVAVDLNGFTKDARPGVLARRCAPVQVGFLGYPGTTGSPFIDYIVADATVIPEASRGHFTEKVAYLPHCYQANRREVEVAETGRGRTDWGLPERGFVFCCFNNSSKILPAVFDRWMRVLQQVDGSVLWLYEGNRWATGNLRAEAGRRGVDPQRLVFAKPLPVEQHLERIRHADLFLDTLPYNAHTTASDSLRIGVPLLTQVGTTFAGRVAASLLRTLGLGELITDSAQQYEAQAVSLATAPERLAAIRARLVAAVERSPLYDSTLFTRQVEDLYEAMYERYRRKLPAEHIVS